MSSFWENELVRTAANFSVVVLCMILFLAIFELVTKYHNMEEIKKGFDSNGITIPFPQRDVHIYQHTVDTDLTRAVQAAAVAMPDCKIKN